MDRFYDLYAYLENPTVEKVFSSFIAIAIFWFVKWLLLKIADRKVEDPKTRYNLKKTIGYVVVTLGFFVIGRIWLQAFDSAVTYLGLLSAGIAIALKDPLSNFVAWIFIIWRKPFVVGNRVQIGEHSGDVIDIRIFQFSILEIGNWVKADQSTGRIIHVPNGLIFIQPVCNYDQGFKYIWNEIPVLITFESNWQKAKKLLKQIIDAKSLPISEEAEKEIIQSAKKYLIFYKNITPIVYTSVEESGVLLTIRYLTDIRKRRGSTEQIWEEILTTFNSEPDIELAYPTFRRV